MKRTSRCWAGYEPTPGKKPYSKGSCRKIPTLSLDKLANTLNQYYLKPREN
jgi:hypothetical protein